MARNLSKFSTELTIVILSAVMAGTLAHQLAAHDVGISAIVAAAAAVISTGSYFAAQIGRGLRTTLYTCPAKGCTAFIRTTGTNPAELDTLRGLATNHDHHTA